MKKRMLAALLLSALLFTLSGCGEKSLLNKKEPVSLTFWHVYGEQAGSPMDLLVQEFNRTVGQEREDRRLFVRDTEGFRAGDAGPLYLPHRRRAGAG